MQLGSDTWSIQRWLHQGKCTLTSFHWHTRFAIRSAFDISFSSALSISAVNPLSLQAAIIVNIVPRVCSHCQHTLISLAKHIESMCKDFFTHQKDVRKQASKPKGKHNWAWRFWSSIKHHTEHTTHIAPHPVQFLSSNSALWQDSDRLSTTLLMPTSSLAKIDTTWRNLFSASNVASCETW